MDGAETDEHELARWMIARYGARAVARAEQYADGHRGLEQSGGAELWSRVAAILHRLRDG
jgi:hypothetical protein